MVCHDGLIDGKQACGEEQESQNSFNTTQKINAKCITIDVGRRLHIISWFKQYQQPKSEN